MAARRSGLSIAGRRGAKPVRRAAGNQKDWRPGRRRRFPFAMPGAENTLKAMKPTETKPATPAEPPKKDAILLVDDEKPLLDVYAAALEPSFEVTTATSAREADFLLQKRAFKVVVADHLMPGGNGMNFLVRAREEFPHMQRVLVTGYMKPEMLLRSVNEAALFRYLLKPVSMAELVKVVQDAAKAHDVSVATAKT
ncbi:MAG: response regulator [Verrucomicrobia bacterium]|nr:response regulator [Verrucomicrobiota bacterium]